MIEWDIIDTMAILAAAIAGGKENVESDVRIVSGIESSRCEYDFEVVGGAATG